MAMAGAKPSLPGIMTGHDSPRGATGSKTPRKVQWMDTHEERPEDSTHALDEHGRDPSAFQTLTTALERHQSASPTDSELSGPPSPTHEVPGNYIGPQEDAGLPGTSDLENYSRRAANQVVRAHTTRKGFFSGFGARRNYARAHSRTASSDVEQDLHSAEPMNPALGGGGGLLSALLTLYNDAGPASGTSTPAASTPGTEEPPELPWVTPPPSVKTFSSLAQVDEDERAPGTARTSPSERGSSTPPSPRADPKPRNGAGVLGALIASTGNISGVAAPVPSQLAPNIKRRYSVQEDDVPTATPASPLPSLPTLSFSPLLFWLADV
ncbi:hypothetical protein B0H14DRAFT_3897529 [Mycena olivaceomarginata]|nr:hypothetical protein B0H14DRAFT_3897529 [Mycena olivaceomarginata]